MNKKPVVLFIIVLNNIKQKSLRVTRLRAEGLDTANCHQPNSLSLKKNQ